MRVKRCVSCAGVDGEVRFAVVAATGAIDSQCVGCRFDAIDRAAADITAIRDEMRATGVPLRGGYAARTLRIVSDDCDLELGLDDEA